MAYTLLFAALVVSAPLASASLLRAGNSNKACLEQDVKNRVQLQNKLAGVCVDMCKEVGAFPKCTCPDFVAPDSTPGVMTWPELLEHMDNLSEWGHGELKAWSKQATAFVGLHEQGTHSEAACLAEDLSHRAQVQNKLAGVCVDMCKEVGAFPKCTCPDFVAPDSTPGVMTWPELLDHMDNLSEWGHGELKAWTKQASFVQGAQKDLKVASDPCPFGYGTNCGGGAISGATKDQVAKILEGILGNLQSHKNLVQVRGSVKQTVVTEQVMQQATMSTSTAEALQGMIKKQDAKLGAALAKMIAAEAPTDYACKYFDQCSGAGGSHGLDAGTKDQVAKLLEGILTNLQSHKD